MELEKTAEEIALEEQAKAGNADAGNGNEDKTNQEGFKEGKGKTQEEINAAKAEEKKAEELKLQEEERVKQYNATQAKKRREAEFNAKLEEERSKIRLATVIDATGGVNPYTDEPIEDAEDASRYLLMKRIEKEGKDPIKDYHSYEKKERKEVSKKEEEQKLSEDWISNDLKDFATKHPDVNVKELLADSGFSVFTRRTIGKEPLANLYEDYLEFTGKDPKKEKELEKKAREEANKQATPGSVKSTEKAAPEFYTREEINAMTQEEVSKNFEKVKASLEHHGTHKFQKQK